MQEIPTHCCDPSDVTCVQVVHEYHKHYSNEAYRKMPASNMLIKMYAMAMLHRYKKKNIMSTKYDVNISTVLNRGAIQNNNGVLGAPRNTNIDPSKELKSKKSPPMLFDIVNCVVDGWNNSLKTKFNREISTLLLP